MANTTPLQKVGGGVPPARLPDDILLQIFTYLKPPGCEYMPIYDNKSENRRTLRTTRLACRALNEIVTPILYKKIFVSLNAKSLSRYRGILSNLLIKESVREVEINLRCHSRLLASDIRSFHRGQAAPLLASAESECDWHTEFAHYDEDDMSEDAVQVRGYNAAWPKLGNMAYDWRKYVKRASRFQAKAEALSLSEEAAFNTTTKIEPHDGTGADADQNGDPGDEMQYWRDSDGGEDYDDHTRILTDGFKFYAAQHAEEVHMIQDQSFARTVAGGLVGGTTPVSIWFTDGDSIEDRDEYGALNLVDNAALIKAGIAFPKQWRELENLKGSEAEDDLLMPARLLSDVPIACHDAGVRIKILSVRCFPLNMSFSSLIPTHARETKQTDPWSRFAVACRGLTDFHFDASNCTPIRKHRLPLKDATIMNGFIAAAVSSPLLEHCKISFGCYEINDGRGHWDRRTTPKTKEFHLAAPMLTSITSRELRDLTIMYVEVDDAALRHALRSLHPAHLKYLYLCKITLTRGRWLDVTNDLHDLVAARPDCGTKPQISFTTLSGAEFGVAKAFDEGDPFFMSSDEERNVFWDKLEEHHHPALQQAVQDWVVSGSQTEPNPLAVLWEKSK